MAIHLDPAAFDAAANKQPDPTPKPAPRSNVHTPEASKELPSVAPTIGTQEANITFRRDPNGRVYYVVTDPQSGSEIRELPPQAVRHVGEQIEEYLRQQDQVTKRVNVKG